MKKLFKDWEANAKKKEEASFYFIRSLKMKNPDIVDRFSETNTQQNF